MPEKMMKTSNEEALKKLQDALNALNAQSVSDLPSAQLANLEKGKAALYAELQALQVKQMDERDADYTTLTTEFRNAKSDLTDLSNWITERKQQDKVIFTILSKGVSLALSLLA
jgi:hypothetical protein|tara:strand:- start:464 stop:805 length:342 start_codon:yes stop_codon:yes gene_type:complete